MSGIRHLDRGRSSQLRPGDNKVLLCTAPNEVVAEAMIRSLTVHGIDCATHHRSASKDSPPGEIPRPIAVDLHVRGSDLERARRFVSQSLDANVLGV
jgi:hypothetical protein